MGAQFLGLVESLAANWATECSLGFAIIATIIRASIFKEWGKQSLFFNTSNVASAVILFTVLISLWFKPSIISDIVVDNAVIVTWGIIYALHDNINDFFKRGLTQKS